MEVYNMKNKLNIVGADFHNNIYTRNGETWDAPTLVEYCKDKKYPTFRLPIEAIPLDSLPFKVGNVHDFIYQCVRVMDVDLNYPIILDDMGVICDGWHRVVRAVIDGKEHIDAIRILEMPTASGREIK